MDKEIQFWFWCWNPFEVDKSRIKKSFVILIVFFVIFFDNTWYILDNFFLHFTGKHWNLWGGAAGGFLIDLPPATIRNWLLSVAPKLRGFFYRKKKKCNETWRQSKENCKNLNLKHCQRHNGPEGWVHLIKVTSWGHIIDHKFKHKSWSNSSSESQLSINFLSKHQHLL